MKKGCCGGAKLFWWLLVVGGLNWGLVGLFNFNLVEAIFGSVSWLERLVYVLVGIGAVLAVAGCPCKKCKSKKCCGGSCKTSSEASE